MKEGYNSYKLNIYVEGELIVKIFDSSGNILNLIDGYMDGTIRLNSGKTYYPYHRIKYIELEETFV